ncbi:unnamed protein product (macronuclear) [Paramecium tetraurelia]|uniref:Protein kinase domain-containing protein n=1 Tax=Paramecium tetraurelia TaxID=5888 RepID=A0CRC4_PARTE|nr:uncharacterized protein GSPATT00009656001 [Paramecium tetraurelia]CAK73341.1 unnamed protein product [Paramecium tetraurelia]|eukprot:XP_001440738.1 hypothetical protein (macronuclear) [Paramecium tetraurelia strain d4-2]
MKGWNNFYKVSQRVKRQENYITDITNFENNNYLINQKIDEYLDYEFPQNECFSLAQLIESMKCNCIKIYKGQVLIIILQVLKHLQQLHQKRLSHGRLKPQNIFIQLKNEKDNKLTIIQSFITIQQIYFINYRYIDDVEYEINYSQDVYDIIDCCIELIQAYSNTLCELLLLIINNLNQYKNNIVEGDIYKVLEFIDLLIKECVDQENQKVKKTKIYPSKLNEQTTSTIQCQEGEEYNMISKRWRISTIFITKFLDVICSQSVDCELGLQNDSIENRIDQYVQYIDTNLLIQEELQIYQIVESIIRQQMMKIIWKNYGEFLESWQQEHDSKCEEIVKIINKRNKYILNNHLIFILNEYNNVKKINDEIQEDIEKNYKFNIVYDEQKAKDQFILELKVQAQNQDFNNIQAFIDNIKTQVKQELQEYYNQILELEILTLIHDLI